MTRRSRRSRRSNASFVARDDDDGRSVERSIDGMVWYGMGSAWVTNGGNTTGDLTRGATTDDGEGGLDDSNE
jgi:hypothetical protein